MGASRQRKTRSDREGPGAGGSAAQRQTPVAGPTPPSVARARARDEVGDRPRTRRGREPQEGHMTTSVNGAGRQRIALDRIAIPGNVRNLDADHVDALAASIKLRGLLVPVIVRRLGDDFELIAG